MDEFTRTFKPFYIIGKIVAFFPFYLTKNGEIKTTTINFIYSVFILTAYMFHGKLQTIIMNNYFQNGSIWSKIAFEANSTLMSHYVLVTSVGNFVQRKLIGKGLKSFLQFDMKLMQTFGVKMNYEFQRKFAYKRFAITIAGFAAIMFTTSFTSLDLTVNYSLTDMILFQPLIFIYLAQLTHLVLFIVIINFIRMRIRILNQNVSKVN